VALDLVPVSPASEGPLTQTFAIAMGVRRGDAALRDRLNRFVRERRAEIDGILAAYHVPRAES
jgi:hypothetical protein